MFTKYLSKLSIIPILAGWRCPVLMQADQMSTADVCEKILPAVFRIISTHPTQNMTIGVGSGFFIKKDGTGLTCAHVISNKYNTYQAKLDSGEECPLEILHSHPTSDIAIVKVKVPKPVPFLYLGDSGLNRRGEQVIHFGNTMFGTITEIDVGYINKLHDDTPKWIEIQMNEQLESSRSGIQYIMTSGSVRPGFSGGPLVNMKGEVVGLIARLYIRGQGPSQENEGASIPINIVKGVIKQMELSGQVRKPYIGLSFTPSDSGLIIVKVQPRSPAEKAGLEVGDLVISANGRHVTKPEDIMTVIGFQMGVVLDLIINRKGKEISIKVYS